MLKLVIGNKAYSSWSLRPWIALRHLGIPFDETVIPLSVDDTAQNIGAFTPAGRVPVLIDGDLIIWESLAILEYLAEQAELWPKERAVRAVARSVSNEMHAGFAELRRAYPMNVRRKQPLRQAAPAADKDIARVAQIFRDARQTYGGDGPFLFGRFCVADAMYAPVVTRLHTYGLVEDDPVVRGYIDTMMGLPAMQDWIAGAQQETWRIDSYEAV